MNDKLFWERFNQLADKVKKGDVVTSLKSKNVFLVKIERSRRENETGRFAVGTELYYDDYKVLAEYRLKRNEILPTFFDVVASGSTFKSLIDRVGGIAEYDLQRAIKSYRKYLTLKNIEEWLKTQSSGGLS